MALAHLMVAQKGTLNLSGTGAYLLVSIPTSSLEKVDDDKDGLLSARELSLHTKSIKQQIQAGLQLRDTDGLRPLEGLMLTLSAEDSKEGQPADQLVVMGRFALADSNKPLSFQVSLWGKKETEQSLGLTITKNLKEEELLMLTPEHPQGKLYEPALNVFASFLQHGIEHVLGGLDHLLFLLVVIATGWGWKQILTALSIFTVGHAISLMTVVYSEITFPENIVEPAIAATIIGLALYDLTRSSSSSRELRFGLVFGCSLIHGLGLGGALAALGINPTQQGATLLGFNLGIEIAQVGVAGLAIVGLTLLQKMFGGRSVKTASLLATLSAVFMGSIWFVERVIN
ncbi:MAG: hypothetical protein RLZZ156_163 [Deinococcota bacterium]